MAYQQCDELVTCYSIFFVFLLSHSFLASIGMMSNHDSLQGDQAASCFCDRDVSSCFVVVCFRLQDHSVGEVTI